MLPLPEVSKPGSKRTQSVDTNHSGSADEPTKPWQLNRSGAIFLEFPSMTKSIDNYYIG